MSPAFVPKPVARPRAPAGPQDPLGANPPRLVPDPELPRRIRNGIAKLNPFDPHLGGGDYFRKVVGLGVVLHCETNGV